MVNKPVAVRRKRAPEDRPLNARQKLLVDEFLRNGGHITNAALKAGYAPKAASEQGSWNLAKPNVKKYLESRQLKLRDKHDVTLDAVIQEFKKIGFANMADYIEDDGQGRPQFKHIEKIGRDGLAVVTELTLDVRREFEGQGEGREQVATVERVRFKLADKVNALVNLGKHLGMFPERDSARRDDEFAEMPKKIIVEVRGGMSRSKK